MTPTTYKPLVYMALALDSLRLRPTRSIAFGFGQPRGFRGPPLVISIHPTRHQVHRSVRLNRPYGHFCLRRFSASGLNGPSCDALLGFQRPHDPRGSHHSSAFGVHGFGQAHVPGGHAGCQPSVYTALEGPQPSASSDSTSLVNPTTCKPLVYMPQLLDSLRHLPT